MAGSNYMCPKCGNDNTAVIDSRHGRDERTRRRRVCVKPECGYKFTTYEMSADALDDMERESKAYRRLAGKLKAAVDMDELLQSL